MMNLLNGLGFIKMYLYVMMIKIYVYWIIIIIENNVFLNCVFVKL